MMEALSRHRLFLVAGMLVFFVVNGLQAAATHTPTIDEFVHLPIGLYHLQTGDHDIDRRSGALIRTLAALPLLFMNLEIDASPRWRGEGEGWAPWLFGSRFLWMNLEQYQRTFLVGRCVVLAIALVGGLIVYQWARRLYGEVVALVCLLLYCTAPTILGHASLATLDVGIATFVVAGFYGLWRYTDQPGWGWIVASGFLFGFALASKSVALLFFPLIPLVLAPSWPAWDRLGVLRFIGVGFAIAVPAWLALMLAYGFDGWPIPTAFLEGVMHKLGDASAPENPSFLLGTWSYSGWPYYYLAAILFKLPVPLLVLIVLGVVALVRGLAPPGTAVWIIAPPLLLIYALSFHYQAQFGIRYLLPGIPFLILMGGAGAALLTKLGRPGQSVLGILLLWQVAECLATTPHQLAYFNQFAGQPDEHRRVLLDSNLDWGQDLSRLPEYLTQNGIKEIQLAYFGHVDPKAYGISYTLPPDVYEPGLYAISANYLAGYPYSITYGEEGIEEVAPGRWTWLDEFAPTARIGRSIYVFDLRTTAIKRY